MPSRTTAEKNINETVARRWESQRPWLGRGFTGKQGDLANPFFTAQLIFQQPLQLFPPPFQCDNLRAGGEAQRRQLDKFIAVKVLDQMVLGELKLTGLSSWNFLEW
ncbi:hypothetical protein CapIbe_023220 [Capra ibex]